MNQRTFIVFCLFGLSLMFIASCSSVNFIANEKTPFEILGVDKSKEEVVVSGINEFYFWGKFPEFWDVDIQDKTNRMGLYLPAVVSIEQNIDWKNVFYSILTLGLYCPTDFRLTFSSAKFMAKFIAKEESNKKNEVIRR